MPLFVRDGLLLRIYKSYTKPIAPSGFIPDLVDRLQMCRGRTHSFYSVSANGQSNFRKCGRVVDCNGLENRRTLIAFREFESHRFRHIETHGCVGKLVTPVDCKSAAAKHCWFNSSRIHQICEISSVGRALRLHRKCRRFEPVISHHKYMTFEKILC